MHLSHLRTPHLSIDDWQLAPGQCWAVLGRNGAGKRHLAQLLCGRGEILAGTLTHDYRNIALL